MPRDPSRPSGAHVLRLSAALYFSGIALLVFVMVLPLLWMVATSLMDELAVFASFHSFYYSNWPYQMAAAVTAIAPILLIFFIAQRYFVRGIQLTGLK